MRERDEERFQQLYTQKYVDKRVHQNLIERVQVFQDKINKEVIFRKSARPALNIYPPNLDWVSDEAPKRIVREVIAKRKKSFFGSNFTLSEPSERSSLKEPPKDLNFAATLNSKIKAKRLEQLATNSTKKVLSGRSQVYVPKKFSLDDPLSKHCRARTPSRNVIIGGLNLEKEYEDRRQQLKRNSEDTGEQEQMLLRRLIQGRQRSIRSQRNNRNSGRRESLRENNGGKGKKDRNKGEKQQVVELQPWSVMAQTQFY